MRKIIFLIPVLIIISLAIPSYLWFESFFTRISDPIDSPKLADLASFLAFILTFWGTLINLSVAYLGYKIYKNFDVNKQYKSKQLDLVVKVASDFSETSISIMLHENKKDPNGQLREIVVGYEFPLKGCTGLFDLKKFDTIYFQGISTMEIFPFLKYLDNPILPSEIASCIRKFNKSMILLHVKKEDIEGNYIVLSNKKFRIEDKLTTGFPVVLSSIYEDPMEFRNDVNELRESIIKWLKDFGAHDVNI